MNFRPREPHHYPNLFGGEASIPAERIFASLARGREAIGLAIGEGLCALEDRDQLMDLGYSKMIDYAREELGLLETNARDKAKLARELLTRPFLREAVCSGRLSPRHARELFPVARGEAEKAWVERAGTLSVRELHRTVKRALGGEPGGRATGGGQGAAAEGSSSPEEERWTVFSVSVRPELGIVVDEGMRLAARVRQPGAVRQGAAGDEPAGTGAAGVWLEKRMEALPQLRHALSRGEVSYEKARLVAGVADFDSVNGWIRRAAGMTCVELERAIARARDAQVCARGRFQVRMPERVAELLQAALRAVSEAFGARDPGDCLALVAAHFVATWGPLLAHRGRPSPVQERDGKWCTTPGCSRPSAQGHHLVFRSHGGGDALSNTTAICAPHHLRGVHGGRLRVSGTAPDHLVWELADGTPFTAGAGRPQDGNRFRGTPAQAPAPARHSARNDLKSSSASSTRSGSPSSVPEGS